MKEGCIPRKCRIQEQFPVRRDIEPDRLCVGRNCLRSPTVDRHFHQRSLLMLIAVDDPFPVGCALCEVNRWVPFVNCVSAPVARSIFHTERASPPRSRHRKTQWTFFRTNWAPSTSDDGSGLMILASAGRQTGHTKVPSPYREEQLVRGQPSEKNRLHDVFQSLRRCACMACELTGKMSSEALRHPV